MRATVVTLFCHPIAGLSVTVAATYGLDRLHRRTDASVLPLLLLLQGPDHGAAPDFPNPYFGERVEDACPELPLALPGLERFAEKFFWPGGFAIHPNLKVPGVTREDGELG